MIFVRTGNNLSKQKVKIDDGKACKGSRAHFFMLEAAIILRTLSSDNRVNSENSKSLHEGADVVREEAPLVVEGSTAPRLDLIAVIL